MEAEAFKKILSPLHCVFSKEKEQPLPCVQKSSSASAAILASVQLL